MKLSPFVLAALMSSAAIPAFAQDGDVSSLDITGTANQAATVATRVPLSALETPFTIVSVSEDIIQNSAAQSLGDVLRYAATIGGTDNFGNAGQFFSSRGFQLDAGNNYFRDGLRYRKYGQTPIYDLDHVEVLRGPASILYGAVQPGGVVNLVTRKPSHTPQYFASLRGGQYKNGQATLGASGPLGEVVRYRLTGYYEDTDSFRDIFHSRSSGVSGIFDMDVTPKTVLTLRGSLFKDHRNSDRGTTTYRDSSGNIVLAPIPRERYLSEPFDYLDFQDVNVSASLRHNFTADWQLRGDIVHSSQREDRLYIWGGTGTTLSQPVPVSGIMDRALGDWDTKLDGTIGRLEVAGRASLFGMDHRLLAGAEFEKFSNFRTDIRYTYPSINIFAPVYLSSLPAVTRTTAVGAGVTNSLYNSKSAYIQDVITVTDHITFLAGVRYDDLSDRNLASTTPNVAKKASPQFGLVYRITPSFSVYGSYATSFKNQSGILFGTVSDPLPPQEGEQTELGAKWDIPGVRTFVTAAVYDLKKTNVPVTEAGVVRLSGLQGSKGAELSVASRLTDQFRVTLNYAYSDSAKFLKDTNLTGKNIRNVPRHNVALWGDYDFKGALHKFHAGVGIVYVGNRWGNDNNQFVLPAYTLVDLNGRYDITDKVQLSVTVKNAFDETYYTGSLEHRSILVGQARTALATLSVKF